MLYLRSAVLLGHRAPPGEVRLFVQRPGDLIATLGNVPEKKRFRLTSDLASIVEIKSEKWIREINVLVEGEEPEGIRTRVLWRLAVEIDINNGNEGTSFQLLPNGTTPAYKHAVQPVRVGPKTRIGGSLRITSTPPALLIPQTIVVELGLADL